MTAWLLSWHSRRLVVSGTYCVNNSFPWCAQSNERGMFQRELEKLQSRHQYCERSESHSNHCKLPLLDSKAPKSLKVVYVSTEVSILQCVCHHCLYLLVPNLQ